MAKLLSLYAALLLLSTTSALVVLVASDQCREMIGPCSNDCNSKCTNAHQGNDSQGICDPGEDGKLVCWCLYDCPELKTCEDGFLPNGPCNDQNCESQCDARHPGRGAHGFCYSIGIGYPFLDSCQCTYYC